MLCDKIASLRKYCQTHVCEKGGCVHFYTQPVAEGEFVSALRSAH